MAPRFLSRVKHFARDRDTTFLSRFKKKRYGDPDNGVAARSTEKIEFPPPELAASSATLPSFPVWQLAMSTASSSQPALPELHLSPAVRERSETAVPQSLWDRAYDALRAKDGRLVEQYEKLLSRELMETTSNSNVLSHDSPDKAEKNLDETDNWINNTDPQKRRAQVDTIIESGLRRMDGRKLRYCIAGHEFVVEDQIARAAGLVQGIKDFIGEAVKVSPEASLVWSGVCAILPILTSPSAAEQATSDGFTYITSRMRFYAALEPLLLLPKDQDHTATVPKDLKNEFESHIVDLYKHILDFQFRSVLQFYQSRLAKLGRDMIQHEDWKGMLFKIQELEKAVTDDFKKVNDLSSRKELEKLNESASGSLETMRTLLSVAERQPQVLGEEEGLQVQKKIANLTKGIDDAGQVTINLPMAENADPLDSHDRSQLLTILGSAVLLTTPLPIRGLATLLEINEDIVSHWLQNLHAVLNVPLDSNAPAQLLHKSFSDFWLGQDGTGTNSFRVNAQETHAMLALKCIQRMTGNNGLRMDICNVQGPGKSSDEIDKVTVARHIPPDLEYACLYWAYHLQHSGRITDEDKVYNFLQTHFLHWLESLSYLRKLSEGILSIKELLKIVQLSSDMSSPLAGFLRDAAKFASSFESIIERAPLQTYGAALVFCPTASKVKQQYWQQRLPFLKRVKGIKHGWDSFLQTLKGHTDSVWAVAFSPDGKTLASASRDKTVRLWDAATGTHKQTLPDHGDWVLAVAFSPDGKTVISSSRDKTVRLWDAATGAHKQTLKGHSDGVFAVAFSPDGKMVASASDDKTIRLWDATTGVHKQTFAGHTNGVRAVAFSPDGETVVSGSRDKTVRLWDATTGAHKQTFEGHRDCVWAVTFSPDGKMIASASLDKMVRFWDASTGIYKQTFEGHSDKVRAVSFSPDGKMVASASDDKTVRLWDTATGACKQVFKSHNDWVRAVAFSPDGKTLASASDDKTIRFWDTAAGADQQTFEGHSGEVRAVAFSPDGKTVASASRDKTIRLWDATTGAHKQTLEGHSDWVLAVAFSPDGKMVSSASYDKTVRLWDAATGACEQTFEGHNDWVFAVAFSPDGKTVASASYDKTVQLWDATTGAHKQTLEGHSDEVRAVAFSPDGKTVASASYDMTVRLWDAATGAHKQTFEGHSDGIFAVAFSPDGEAVVSISLDKTVRLWAFSPDGETVVSGSRGETVRFSDAAAGAYKQIFDGHNFITSLSFSEDGQYLRTNGGLLRLNRSSINANLGREDPIHAVFVTKDWITRDEQNAIWLPPDYRVTCAAFYDNILVLGHDTGRVTFFGFSSS